jgi:antitoxin StbD
MPKRLSRRRRAHRSQSINGRGVTAYLVAADVFEAFMDAIEDVELREIVNERRGEPTIKVNLDEL